jgi:uncharacterized protein (TIGR00106 family)
MPVLEISITPVGTNQASFSDYVAEACKIVTQKGLKYQVTPTSTVVEGDLQQLMDIASSMHQTPLKMGAERVITNIKIDERQDKNMDMESQVRSVGEKLQ